MQNLTAMSVAERQSWIRPIANRMGDGRARASGGSLYPHYIIADLFSTGLVEKKFECLYSNMNPWNY